MSHHVAVAANIRGRVWRIRSILHEPRRKDCSARRVNRSHNLSCPKQTSLIRKKSEIEIRFRGGGPVGLFTIRSAFLLGAERVLAVDTVPERHALAKEVGAITIDFKVEDVYDRVQELTGGRGADACVDAVGTEASATGSFDAVVDRIKVATFMGTDWPHVLRQAIRCCRNFGVISIVGVYGGLLDKIPMGPAINRGLTFRMDQTPVQHYLP